MKLEDIVVNDELAALMPQLDDMEYMQLENNILEAGEVTEALRVWGNVLIDGHNRYSILKNHPEIGYKVKKIEFDNLDDAKMWIYKNQLGRRNLNKQQKTYYIGKQYLLEKELREKIVRNEHDEKGRFTVVPQNEAQRCSERTSEKIAKDNNVSRATVERAGAYVKGLEIAESIDPGFENEVLSGKVKVTQKQMMDIGQGWR